VDALFDRVRCAPAYRDLSRRRFDLVVDMLSGRYGQARPGNLRPGCFRPGGRHASGPARGGPVGVRLGGVFRTGGPTRPGWPWRCGQRALWWPNCTRIRVRGQGSTGFFRGRSGVAHRAHHPAEVWCPPAAAAAWPPPVGPGPAGLGHHFAARVGIYRLGRKAPVPVGHGGPDAWVRGRIDPGNTNLEPPDGPRFWPRPWPGSASHGRALPHAALDLVSTRPPPRRGPRTSGSSCTIPFGCATTGPWPGPGGGPLLETFPGGRSTRANEAWPDLSRRLDAEKLFYPGGP
jgi:hypothetical protein